MALSCEMFMFSVWNNFCVYDLFPPVEHKLLEGQRPSRALLVPSILTNRDVGASSLPTDGPSLSQSLHHLGHKCKADKSLDQVLAGAASRPLCIGRTLGSKFCTASCESHQDSSPGRMSQASLWQPASSPPLSFLTSRASWGCLPNMLPAQEARPQFSALERNQTKTSLH